MILTPDKSQEVVVTGQKPLIERKADKTVLNISGNKFLEGKNVLQALEYAPGLWIDQFNEKIQIKGQNVLVMINGQRSYVKEKDLMNYLKSLPGNAVKSIEIISNPSAKYEAESAGIINIITDKKAKRGLSVNLLEKYTGGKRSEHDSSLMLDAGLSEKLSFSFLGAYRKDAKK